ncbi:DUF4160 domain-containing protein [Evansella tamaricis]|uniref:DUF4160 domain-containing protein n=1 Tax=Evansella tamaricis TaxID=2069301 RepID=A0ABS6JDD7_9BACI|nr:DUF4160 domain-containing protein [Evansella tamaricis]MBU9711687.1 DUF4160 domain-containing protein [Evansella tamaricis]
MPRIGECNGLSIYMHYNDHPPPHFHIRGGENAMVSLDGEIIEGSLSPKVKKVVTNWALNNHQKLQDNWDRALRQLPLEKI